MNILFAENSKKNVVCLKQETIKDLALWEVVDNIVSGERDKLIIRDIFSKLLQDAEDIRFRQEILTDFMENDGLTEDLAVALSGIRTLKEYDSMKAAMLKQENTLYVLLEKLRELSVYVTVSEEIVNCLQKYEIKSVGLKSVLDHLSEVVRDENFEPVKKDIAQMLEELSNVRGAMVGVNFTPDLDIEQVAMVEFLPCRIRSKYKFAELAASMSNAINGGNTSGAVGMAAGNTRVLDPLLVSMTPQIEKHLKRHFTNIKNVMAKYVKLDAGFITEMYEGLTFYISLARFAKRLKMEGHEITMPLLKPEKKSFELKDFYNIRLCFAGEKKIVKNDFTFQPRENLYILTGPNRGGKTILEQALGIISVMASVGVFVTASSCEGMPFRKIFTHFPIDENLTINYGRLGEEAVRIKEIVKEADDSTLILFNETYSTTSASDGLYLSMDLLRILKEFGSAVIFNTHIHELATAIEEMNRWEGESDVVSIAMEIVNNENTFRLKRSKPDLQSYASNIAKKYGITYRQMRSDREEDEISRNKHPE